MTERLTPQPWMTAVPTRAVMAALLALVAALLTWRLGFQAFGRHGPAAVAGLKDGDTIDIVPAIAGGCDD